MTTRRTRTRAEKSSSTGTSVVAPSPSIPGKKLVEVCCMCGDIGLSLQLFLCKFCRFRSQHNYCSNLYPKSGSYQICNWCLTTTTTSTKKEEIITKLDKSRNSSISSYLIKTHVDRGTKIKKRESDHDLQLLSPLSPRKKILRPNHGDRDHVEEKFLMRRSLSHEIISSGTTYTRNGLTINKVFRHKVRRYKLLDEVSS